MSIIVEGIDFIIDLLKGNMMKTAYGHQSGQSGLVTMSYLSVVFFWCYVWALQTNRHFSSVMTAGALMQCLGLAIMAIKIHGRRSVKGLSSQMFVLFFIFLCMRLTCTCLVGGYIPTDRSGCFVYQLCDAVSLLIVIHLLYSIHRTYVHTYDDERDSLSISTMVSSAIVMSAFVHGWLNKCFIFDTLWAASLNVETLVLLPQFQMMANDGYKICGMTKHFVALWIASRACYYTFWSYASGEIISQAPEGVDGYVASWYIMGAYVLQLVLSGNLLHCCVETWLGRSIFEGQPKRKCGTELMF